MSCNVLCVFNSNIADSWTCCFLEHDQRSHLSDLFELGHICSQQHRRSAPPCVCADAVYGAASATHALPKGIILLEVVAAHAHHAMLQQVL